MIIESNMLQYRRETVGDNEFGYSNTVHVHVLYIVYEHSIEAQAGQL